jgi:phosphoglycolate phosphatase-like HAD superfamily hydrolase
MALSQAEDSPIIAALIGDSVSDVQAARAAGVASIGFRPDAVSLSQLVDAGADAAVLTMDELAGALRRWPLT